MVSKTYVNDGLEGRPTTIAAGADWIIDPTSQNGGVQDYMNRFMPFNSLFVRNNDSNEIIVYPNNSPQRQKKLPQGATTTVVGEPYNFLRIRNNGAGIVAQGNIVVEIEKVSKK